jgi:EAL domain-containing protein (putative c-di-GMP-specific phosphodiesterase class I)
LNLIEVLQPDIIKLDCGLLPTKPSSDDRELLAGITQHAKARGVDVIAGGIETAEQVQAARQAGVDFAQGWFFGRPSPVAYRKLPADALAA